MMAWRSSAATASLMLLCIFKTHAVQIMEVQVPSTVEVPSLAWLLLCFLGFFVLIKRTSCLTHCGQVLKRTSGGTARHRAGLQLPFRLTRGGAAGSEVVFQQGLNYFCPFCPLMSTSDKKKLFRIQRPSFNGSPASLGASLRYPQDFVLKSIKKSKQHLVWLKTPVFLD